MEAQNTEKAVKRRNVLERLLRVWEANPHLRLGQLMRRNLQGVDIEYVFDDELLSLFESTLPKRERLKAQLELPV